MKINVCKINEEDFKFDSKVCKKIDKIDKMIFEVNELYENGKMSKEEEIKFENWRYNVKEFI